MTKRYHESTKAYYPPITAGRQYSDELCFDTPPNLNPWTTPDQLELSCRMGLDENGPKITFKTGDYTEINIAQVCSAMTSDPKDQKACVNRLNRGLYPGIDGENGKVTIYLRSDGDFSFRENSLFTNAPRHNVTELVSAIRGAQYTQRTPDMTTLRIQATVKDNPIIGDISLGILAFSLITTLIYTLYLKTRQVVAANRYKRRYGLTPIPLNSAYEDTATQQLPVDFDTTEHSPGYDEPQYYFPKVPAHSKNKKA